MLDLLADPPTSPAHGTRRRYRLELRLDGEACEACSAANARYQRGYRARDQAVPWDQLTLEV